jgi:predicted nuclease of predicted toxin-antitoxin system
MDLPGRLFERLKVLIDEMHDGWDVRLQALGHEAYSVKKLRSEGKLKASDFSVITYAKDNGMVLITSDTESGKGCQENSIPCILLDDNELFKIVIEKISGLK